MRSVGNLSFFVLSALVNLASPGLARAQWHVDGAPLCTAGNDQVLPTIAADGAGGAIVTWSDLRRGYPNYDIYAQHVLASGAVDPAWPVDGRAVCTANHDQVNPIIISDGAGGAIIGWIDRRGGCCTQGIYAQHVLGSGAVDPAWPVDGRALCTAASNKQSTTIVSDGAGGAILTWDDNRSGTSLDIYAQRVLASGAVDPAWPVDGRALCSTANDQQRPAIVSDGASGAVVTWEDNRSGTSLDIYAQRVRGSGAVDPAWPVDGRALCTAANTQYSTTIVSDGAGGGIVTWEDYRGGANSDIYAQHVLASGVVDPAWPVDGRTLCIAPNYQSGAIIGSDAAGGAIVAWTDYRNGRGNGAIYAQHVLASGAVDPVWLGDGRALCTTASYQYPPYFPGPYKGIVQDGAGGAVVTWTDLRSGSLNYDIYAQHVLASGVVDPAWPVDGRAVCAAADNQQSPTIVSDGTGGAIITWTDYRNGTPDIYAARIYAGGTVAAVAGERIQKFILFAPQPNPAQGDVTIRLDLSAPERVSFEIFDASGRGVRTLAAWQEYEAGTHGFTWDTRDMAGALVKNGIYLARVRAAGSSLSRKLVVVR